MTKTVTLSGALDRYLKTVSCEKFIDFEDIIVAGNDRQSVIEQAAVKLLKKLAVAAQSGRGIPSPGTIGKVSGEVILINPLS